MFIYLYICNSIKIISYTNKFPISYNSPYTTKRNFTAKKKSSSAHYRHIQPTLAALCTNRLTRASCARCITNHSSPSSLYRDIPTPPPCATHVGVSLRVAPVASPKSENQRRTKEKNDRERKEFTRAILAK